MEAYVMFGVSTVTGLILSIFWKWVDSLKKSQEADRKKISELLQALAQLKAEMYRDYQSKPSAHQDSEEIKQLLRDIKADVIRVQEKLDKKADKD